jgi:hypothetical protein
MPRNLCPFIMQAANFIDVTGTGDTKFPAPLRENSFLCELRDWGCATARPNWREVYMIFTPYGVRRQNKAPLNKARSRP